MKMREEYQAWAQAYRAEHGDRPLLVEAWEAAYAAGQRAEREACAQECERVRSVSAVSYETGSACAAAIRNRKEQG